MKVINLGEQNSILGTIMAELRDISIQKDSLRFRYNLERIGEIFAYEISKTMHYSVNSVTTPLGIADVSTCDSDVVVATILRAGLPLHQGILHFFDKADNAFIAAYRKYDKAGDFDINIEYCTCPMVEGKQLILADAMMATGASIEVTYNKICEVGGTPEHTHLVSPVCSVYAVEYLQKHVPGPITLWTAAIDEELSAHSYIIPGIGDVGDLAFGKKL